MADSQEKGCLAGGLAENPFYLQLDCCSLSRVYFTYVHRMFGLNVSAFL